MNEHVHPTNPPSPRSELGPHDTGRWLVVTQGSSHLWDLDAGTYQRIPGDGRSRFQYDEVVVAISRVGRWPVVGKTFLVWFDDLAHPDSLEQWRQSSTIREIRSAAEDV